MPVQTCPPNDQILAFVLGKLPDPMAETVAGHLDACTKCDGTAALLEHRPDRLLAEIKRPTGDTALIREVDFRRASQLVADFGHEPSAVGVNRRAARQATGNRLGQYQLLEMLGEGGMGAVYKALHTRLEKIVAVKVLPPDRLRDPAAVARFEREMKAVGKLDHPHIVRAMDAGEADGMHYLVMEYVEGIDLARLSKRCGALPIAEACELVRQAAIGLAAAHRHGMVHRDIKPGNLMLASGLGTRDSEFGAEDSKISLFPSPDSPAPSPTLKILDLGLALLADPNDDRGYELTGSGQVMGTIDYMAPEQGSSSRSVDARADIYSLGATLYKLLTGAAVLDGEKLRSPMEKMVALATEPAAPVRQRRPDVPENLAHIVEKMIAKKPEDRFASAAEVAQALGPWAAGANLAALVDPSAKLSSGPAPITRPNAGTGNMPVPPPMPVPLIDTGKSSVSPKRHGALKGSKQAGLLAATGVAATVIGVIFLAVIFSLRTPQGSITVEVDPKSQKDVSLLVTGGGEEIEVNEKSGWQIKVREGQYHVHVRNSADKFEISHDDIVVRRGDNMVVRVTRKPPVAAVAADVDDDDGGKTDMPPVERNVAEEVLRWLSENNSHGPDSDLVADARKHILKQTELGLGFSCRLSGSLMKSGRPMEIATHGPHWAAYELTTEQAKVLTLTDKPVAGFRPVPQQMGRWEKNPEFDLVSLELDGEDTLGKDGHIQGWLRFKRLRPGTPKSHYFLRVALHHDNAMIFAEGIAGDLTPEGDGKVRLEMTNPLPKGWDANAMMIFVDLGKFAEGKELSDDFSDFIALSAPLSRVITLYQTEK